MSRGRLTMMSLVTLSLRPDPNRQRHLLRAALSSAAAPTPQRTTIAHSDGPPRVAAPPRAVWNVPPAAAIGVQREARSVAQTITEFILPRPAPTTVIQGPIRPQQVGPVPPGDLRLVEFMEQVKLELWEFNAMPLRKRFRVQSLLRYDVRG